MKSKPQILMFAPLCYPPAGSEAIATAKLLLAALDAEWEIDVISQSDFGQYYPTSDNGVWKPLARIVHNIAGIRKGGFFENVNHWRGLKAFNSLQSISWAKKALFTGLRLVSKKKYDFILSRATPQYGHLPALILSRWSGLPWIANWSDPIPPQKGPPPYGEGPDSPIPHYLRSYCSSVARNATWHTFPCERLRKYFCSYLPECTEKSSVIPHIALARFRSESVKANDGFSLCHVGSLTFRNPDVFLEGVRRFLEKNRVEHSLHIKFVGLPLESLGETTRKLGLDDIVSMERARSYEDSQEILAESNVLVVLEAPCNQGIFFPSKFVDFVQTGRPILAVSPVNGTLADILTASGGGIVADCLSPDAVEVAIKTLYVAWKRGSLESMYGSSRLFNLFDENYVIGQYLEIFSRIRNETGSH
jgi:glycosyltransferase involved in cell wall biosynthesis